MRRDIHYYHSEHTISQLSSLDIVDSQPVKGLVMMRQPVKGSVWVSNAASRGVSGLVMMRQPVRGSVWVSNAASTRQGGVSGLVMLRSFGSRHFINTLLFCYEIYYKMAASVDDRKSLSSAFLAISYKNATFVFDFFLHKIAAGGHFG